ncbi:hypothetical protein [Haloparvum sp. AD34]
MATALADLQQELAASPSPAATFEDLPVSRRREIFFQLPDAVEGPLVADADAAQLRSFVGRLDPDEATDVLRFFTFLGLAKWVLGI